MGPVGSEHRLRASLFDHPVQIMDGHAELAHDRGGRRVVPPHVGLGPVEFRASPRVPLVQDRSRVGEDQRGIGPGADPGDDPPQVLGVPIELDLMAAVGLEPLQVVQATVQMHDVGLLPEDPLVEVGEHVGAVAAVLRRADDDRLAGEPLSDPGCVAQADRIADEHHSRQPGPVGTMLPGRGSVGSLSKGQPSRRERPQRASSAHPPMLLRPQLLSLLVHDFQLQLAAGGPQDRRSVNQHRPKQRRLDTNPTCRQGFRGVHLAGVSGYTVRRQPLPG